MYTQLCIHNLCIHICVYTYQTSSALLSLASPLRALLLRVCTHARACAQDVLERVVIAGDSNTKVQMEAYDRKLHQVLINTATKNQVAAVPRLRSEWPRRA